MKILLINVTYGIGSTGKIVESLYENYTKLGHDVRVIFGRHSNKTDPAIIKGGFEFESKIYHFFSRFSGNLYGGMPLSTLKIKRLIKKINPDVVHLHCINGFCVNVYSLVKFLKKNHIRTVLTNHSDFMFTANCGYALECEKWKSEECRNCQRIHEFNGKYSLNRTHKFYKKMEKAFAGFEELTVTNVSPWLNNRCSESPIFNNIECTPILNPVSPAFFDKTEDNPYESFGLKSDCKKVLYVTSNFLEKEKGGHFLEPLAKRFEKDNVQFFVISSVKCEDFIKRENVTFIQDKLSQQQLASFYSKADCSLLLSKNETFSMVVAESLSSGTPIVGFEAGGPETIGIEEYSHFVEQGSLDQLEKELRTTLSLDIKKECVSSKAKDKYKEDNIASSYLNEYSKKESKPIKKDISIFMPILVSAYFACLVLTNIIPNFQSSTRLGILLRAGILGIFSLLTIIYGLKKKIHLRPAIKVALGLIFVGTVIVTLVTPLKQTINGIDITYGKTAMLKNIGYPIAIGVQLYATMELLPRDLSSNKTLRFFIALIGLSVAAFSIYALIDQFDAIKEFALQLVGKGGTNPYISNPHRNLNGFILFVGFASLVYLSQYTKPNEKKYVTILSAWTYFVICLTLCKGAIIFGLLLILVLFIFSFKKHLRANIIISSVVGALIVGFIIVMLIPSLRSIKIINAIYESFFNQFFKSMAARIDDLSKAGPLFNDWRIVFGYGEGFWEPLPHAVAGMGTTDCAFLITPLTAGLIGLFFELCLYVYAYYNAFLLLKKDKKIGVISLAIISSFFIYSFYIGDGMISLKIFGLSFELLCFSLPKASLFLASKGEEKHVLHIVECLDKGGTEAFIYNYYSLMKEKDYSFDIYCLGHIDQAQRNRFEAAGITIYQGVLPSIKNYVKSALLFGKFLHEHNYSIIHTNANLDSSLYLRIANYQNIDVRVCHAHDTLTGIKLSAKEKIMFAIKRFACHRNGTDFCACSLQAGYDLLGAKFFARRGSIINNVICIEDFINKDETKISELKEKYNISSSDFVIGNISRFQPKKNQEFIVDLFKDIYASNQNALLVLGGVDGGQEEYIKSKIKEYGLEERTRFIGPRSDVKDWLHVFDLYLFPSLFEGFGIVCLENQAAGLYTIASTNVPQLTNLGINLIDYLSLEEKEKWIEKIISFKKSVISKEEILEQLEKKGFASTKALESKYELR